MEQQRKWTGWLLIAVIIVISGTALVMTTLASSDAAVPMATDSPMASAAPAQPPAAAAQPAAPMQRTANASAIGYGGPVLVRLTLDEAGAIAALDIGGARFQETQGIGSKVTDPGFAETFIGKKPPLSLNEDVDAVAGASVSSKAVVDAVNDAAEFLTKNPDASDKP